MYQFWNLDAAALAFAPAAHRHPVFAAGPPAAISSAAAALSATPSATPPASPAPADTSPASPAEHPTAALRRSSRNLHLLAGVPPAEADDDADGIADGDADGQASSGGDAGGAGGGAEGRNGGARWVSSAAALPASAEAAEAPLWPGRADGSLLSLGRGEFVFRFRGLEPARQPSMVDRRGACFRQ